MLVIARGIAGGIERINKVLIPALFVILCIAVVRALTLPGAGDGVRFLFTFHLADLGNSKIWLDGLSQSAWSTGAGAGLILTYSVYARSQQNVVNNSVYTGLGNNAASLLAALALIPTVFAVLPHDEALATLQTPGPHSTGMTFIYFPQVLTQIAGGATVFLPLFFLAIALAALSSMLAVLELGVRNLSDLGLQRRRAVVVIFAINFLVGLPSAMSPAFFSNQDWVWGLGLTVSGVFFAIAARKIGIPQLLQWIHDAPGWRVGKRFGWIVLWLIPIQLAVLMGWCLHQSITHSERWWDPFSPTSVGSAFAQWLVVILAFVLLNSWLVRHQRDKQ